MPTSAQTPGIVPAASVATVTSGFTDGEFFAPGRGSPIALGQRRQCPRCKVLLKERVEECPRCGFPKFDVRKQTDIAIFRNSLTEQQLEKFDASFPLMLAPLFDPSSFDATKYAGEGESNEQRSAVLGSFLGKVQYAALERIYHELGILLSVEALDQLLDQQRQQLEEQIAGE